MGDIQRRKPQCNTPAGRGRPWPPNPSLATPRPRPGARPQLMLGQKIDQIPPIVQCCASNKSASVAYAIFIPSGGGLARWYRRRIRHRAHPALQQQQPPHINFHGRPASRPIPPAVANRDAAGGHSPTPTDVPSRRRHLAAVPGLVVLEEAAAKALK